MYQNNSKKILNSAIDFMKKNITQKLRVGDVALYCEVSASWMEKTFAKLEGKGVMRYFLDLKLEYATKMLKEGYRINDIAEYLNFSSAAHFSMAFKKKYEISPLKYKYGREKNSLTR